MAYGIRWSEFDRSDRAVTKEKFFKTAKARNAFATKLQDRANFWQVLAICNN